MKAVLFEGVGMPLRPAELDRPAAGPGGLLVKVGACGICASDLHAAEVAGIVAPGNVFGHEYAGEVVEVGPGVEGGWQVGDRMIALPSRPCGTCPACLAGQYAACADLVIQGFDPRMPGAYAEFTSCVAALATRLPEGLEYRDGALVEPLAVGLGAARTGRIPPGGDVLVVGAGIIGLATAKWAKFLGAGTVAVSERVPARIERARKAGADLVIDAAAVADPVAEFRRLTGRAPSVIFECVGRPMIRHLVEIAPKCAHLVMVGTGMQPEEITVFSAALKRLTMSFTLAYEAEDFGFILRMLATGRIDTEGLVTGTVDLDGLPAMFAALQKPNDHCKVLVTP